MAGHTFFTPPAHLKSKVRTKKVWVLRAASILLAIIIPAMVACPIIYIESRHQAESEAHALGEVVLRQTESILAQAANLGNVLASFAGQPCDAVKSELQQLGTFRPYFRALVLVEGSTLYCSSATGSFRMPVAHLYEGHGDMPKGQTFLLVAGTPMVPDRPALLVMNGLPDGRGTIVTVDGQYLLDLLTAADSSHLYDIALKVGGIALLQGNGVAASGETGEVTRSLASPLYPVTVEASVMKHLLGQYRRALALRYLPLLLLVSAVLAYVIHRYQMRRLSFAEDIRRGMRNEEFHVQYQPVMDLDGGQCTGVEALMRWERQNGCSVRPDVFFAAAEDNGVALALTRHLFGLVQRDIANLNVPANFHLGVNITAEHLASAHIVADVEGLMHAVQGKPLRLVLEITERKALPDSELVRKNMSALHALGVRFAFDDFGTGHSSLAYLQKFAVEYIKIDKGFVSVIDTDAVNAPVLDLIISLGVRLGVGLIAEGIETLEQARYLRRKGVKWGQGFLFARPMSPAALQVWLGRVSTGGGWA